MRKRIISIIIPVFIISFNCSCDKKTKDTYCKTKYPILLVHGVGFRDDTKIVTYWGKVVKPLEKRGAHIILAHQQAYASHRDNAILIKKMVESFLAAHPEYKKINIIAHSKGGLESRYMISKLGMADKVASLTTLATPHRGSSIADIVMGKVKSDNSVIAKLINSVAKLFGDKRPDSYDAGLELTTGYMKKFNREVPDSKEVYYQSYAAEIDKNYPNLLWRNLWKTLNKYEGPNDGLVSVKSAAWGDFKGAVRDHGKPRVSHADIIGVHIITGVFSFREDLFFEELAHKLKVMGY